MLIENKKEAKFLSNLYCLKLDSRPGHLGWSHTIFLVTTTPQEQVYKEGKPTMGQDLHRVRLQDDFHLMDLENGLRKPVSEFFSEHPNASWVLLELSATMNWAIGYEFKSRVLQWAEK